LSDEGETVIAFCKLLQDGSIVTGLGLLITLIGAAWTASGVMITPVQAHNASKIPYGGPPNPNMVATLMFQSKRARHGLWAIAIGTLLQISGLVQHMIQAATG
jgi:hypothetical protein